MITFSHVDHITISPLRVWQVTFTPYCIVQFLGSGSIFCHCRFSNAKNIS
jgi:hypothetical protein